MTQRNISTWLIGDLQGCHGQTVALLEHIAATEGEAAAPRILFAGDLINRGPDSLATLRHVRALAEASGGRVDSVLGNHDLHLLAVAHGIRPPHPSDTLDAILAAPDRAELIDWLRRRPLAIEADGHLLVHAGVLPQWSKAQALALAGEVEARLRGADLAGFLGGMYGNAPAAWDEALEGAARLRVVVNAMTRLRFCDAAGVMDFKMKESGTAPEGSGLMPWFEVPGRRSESDTVAFGHWSALGLLLRPNLIGLDSGCVWGGQLTAVRLHDRALLQVPCPSYQQPGGKN